ncbi:type II toxin-antitoxin system HipA family toxin [Marinobacter bryozoorum]|uniref:type II toxin-antitoxin system HipA family toxin n=1 Tax=Marinobacter bryozoorum TaxID=256324 RepID=UPI00200404A9|nr:type II toxin-antitoxin system HipA family toxin [Marinobacter bryozoorum]MCK7545014.1 type II toxin-antitoxin system HipA family toxin [Marinobacter bryozoorum]
MARLTIAMNGIEVGHLTLERSGAMTFEYRRDWIAQPGARAISLSLPLSSRPYRGERVYNFFDNLLPDSEAIRARMQARFQTPTNHPFDLLASVGRDCIGAIQLYPENQQIPDVTTISSEPISETEIERLLGSYQRAPLGMEKEHDFRISLAGAQEKTALLWHNNQWQRPRGSTPTTHIFKLPIGYLEHSNIDLRESSENEWLCLQLLAAFGLPVANADLAQFGQHTVLIVERFDRRWSADRSWLLRLPQEDFCQALGISPALKYENEGGPGIHDSMELLLGSQQANEDRTRFFKTQILFWLLAAIDGHAKNFSLYIEPGSAYRMTPLYDVISAYPLMAKGSLPASRAKMAMSLKGKSRHYHWARIQPRHFLNTARQVGFSAERAKSLIHEVIGQAEQAVQAVEARIPTDFPSTISESILGGVRQQATVLAQSL